jgi:aryl-alcohol dehydrogenase-like predicted oxidoreductase
MRISRIAFGAGPVPGLLTASGGEERQTQVIAHAVEAGINWFDTAATYGAGESERSLGAALKRLGAESSVHVATKVRLLPDQLGAIPRHVRESVAGSLERLGLPCVTLLQVHNAITARRDDEPFSITPDDILGPRGMLGALRQLQADGFVRHLGITAIGAPGPLHDVVRSGEFTTIQVPYHLANPSAGRVVPEDFSESNYGNIIAQCARLGMGVLAIRVYAGGALAGNPPSPYTHETRFFPLPLYQRDQQRARQFEQRLAGEISLKEAALRFVLSHPSISAAIVGFSEPWQIDEARTALEAGPLPVRLLQKLSSGDHHG